MTVWVVLRAFDFFVGKVVWTRLVSLKVANKNNNSNHNSNHNNNKDWALDLALYNNNNRGRGPSRASRNQLSDLALYSQVALRLAPRSQRDWPQGLLWMLS